MDPLMLATPSWFVQNKRRYNILEPSRYSAAESSLEARSVLYDIGGKNYF